MASSDTEIYENPIVKKEEASASVPPPESSDSQAEGPFTNRSDSEGTESAPESKRFPRAIANELLFPCKYFKKFQLNSLQLVSVLIKLLIFL